MGTTIARSEITIVDLYDSATYIYYSEYSDGRDAQSAPTDKTKYIGIYNGAAIPEGRPIIPPEGTSWSKYMGDDGQKGDKGDTGPQGPAGPQGPEGQGVTVSYYDIEYALSGNGENPPSSGWNKNFPTGNSEGKFLWARTTIYYSDGSETISYSVSYSGTNGQDASTHYIETNQEEILRFEEKEGTTYSPEILTFNIYQSPRSIGDMPIVFDNFKFQVLTSEGFVDVNKNFLELEDNKTLKFYVKNFYGSSPALTTSYGGKNFFRFWYCENENNKVVAKAIKIIESRIGFTSDMMDLSVHANDIVASIQNSLLKFDGTTGLTIKNGGLKIYKTYDEEGKEEEVLGFDKNTGDLKIKGHITATGGTFKGTLEGVDGTFTGTLSAPTGDIGGFNISGGALISNAVDSNKNPYLTLDGLQGKLTTRNLEIVSGHISNKLTFGEVGENPSCYLCNPNVNDSVILKAKNTILTDQGILKLGNIRLVGRSSKNSFDAYIGHVYEDTNGQTVIGNWKIQEDGYAEFRNLRAKNVILESSILEIGHVQSAGSLTVFKEGWKVAAINGYTITLENYSAGLSKDDWIIANNDKYYKVTNVQSNLITLNKQMDSSYTNTVVIKLGKSKSDYIISILGTNRDIIIGEDYATPNSLTIANFSTNANNEMTWTKHLVLGNLSDSGFTDPEITGFGLYADNVYLNGSLTTKNEQGYYAGINTQHNIVDNKNQRVVFWAGATKGLSEENILINEAPFRVTENGTIYAREGIFEGSIITKSEIHGSDIYTARLYGENNGTASALSIYGTQGTGSSSISFYDISSGKKWNEDNAATKIFSIGTSGFKFNNTDFIDLSKVSPRFIGELKAGHIEINCDNTNKLKFAKNLETESDFFVYNSSSNLFVFQDTIEKLSLSNNLFIKTSTHIFDDLWLGENMHYQKTSEGYDLFID